MLQFILTFTVGRSCLSKLKKINFYVPMKSNGNKTKPNNQLGAKTWQSPIQLQLIQFLDEECKSSKEFSIVPM